jgi:hypothetical protein
MNFYQHQLKVTDNYVMSSSGTMFIVVHYLDEDGDVIEDGDAEEIKLSAVWLTVYSKEEGFLTINLDAFNAIKLNG